MLEHGSFLVVADNARNMQAALREVNEQYPSILGIGCMTHLLNLLISDIFGSVPTVKEVLNLVDQMV